MMPTLLSLTTPQAVVMTTFSAIGDNNKVGIMKIIGSTFTNMD